MSVPPDMMTSNQGMPTTGGSPTSTGTPPWLSDLSSVVGVGGNLASLINAIQLQNTAGQNLSQSNPFGAFRPLYGQQLLQLMQNPNSVSSLPGYQFQLQQGVGALDRSAAAPGGVGFGSGAEGAELMQFGEGLASNFYDRQIATLSQLAGANIAPANAAQMLTAAGGAAGGVGTSITGLTQSTLGLLGKLFPGTTSSSTVPGDPNAYNPATSPFTGAPGQTSVDWGMAGGSTPGATPDMSTAPDTGDPFGGNSLDLSGMFTNPRAAGGEAATAGAGTQPASGVSSLFGGVGSSAQTAASLLNIIQGIQSGKPIGAVQAGVGTAALANRAGAFGPGVNPNVGYGLEGVGGALALYQGLQRGGVSGYGGAMVGGLELASGAAGLSGDTALAGELGSAAGYVAAPLAVYNFAQNWQSGKTGSDALQGAEAGAAIGSVIPVVGTVLGAVIGGVLGAASSAFGGGATDPETHNWQGFINATGGASATPEKVKAASANMSPQVAFNLLSGVMDIKDNRIPIVNVFGHMGETNLLNQMTSEINSAIMSGQISRSASPDQIFSQVVSPWLNSKGATITPETGGLQLQAVLTNLIGGWQSGELTSATSLTGSGSRDLGLPTYGA